jgi:hypothetical protein
VSDLNILLKLLNAAGVVISPAQQETLETIGDLLAMEDFAQEGSFLRRFDAVVPKSIDVAAADTHLVAEPSGPTKALIVTWLFDQAVGALGEGFVECAWKFDSTSGGSGELKYRHENTGSQPFSHGMQWRGAAGEKLYLITGSAARVLANADVKEYTP